MIKYYFYLLLWNIDFDYFQNSPLNNLSYLLLFFIYSNYYIIHFYVLKSSFVSHI